MSTLCCYPDPETQKLCGELGLVHVINDEDPETGLIGRRQRMVKAAAGGICLAHARLSMGLWDGSIQPQRRSPSPEKTP